MERALQTIRILETSLREQGFQTALDDSIPERPGFRTLIPLREENAGFVRMELHYVSCGNLFDVLQFYTTIIEDLNEHGLRELGRAVPVWNFSVFLGALGVREDLCALYHRYSLALPRTLSAEECAVISESVLVTILNHIALFQEDAIGLAHGMTFAELQAESAGGPAAQT